MNDRELAEELPTPQNRDMDKKTIHVGFIGLGDQGAPMARAIAEAGWPLHVWARHPSSLAVLADAPHTTHDSVPDLGHACDIVGLCLTDDSDVREILEDLGLLPSLRPSG